MAWLRVMEQASAGLLDKVKEKDGSRRSLPPMRDGCAGFLIRPLLAHGRVSLVVALSSSLSLLLLPSRFLVKNLSLQNCFGMYSLAQAHKSRSLRHAALHLLTVNFERTSEEEQFLQLDLSTLTALLASNHLAAASELKVYQAVRRWVQVQPSERRPLLGELMTHVRLPLFSAEEQAELQRDLEQWGDLHLEWKQMDGVERMRCSRGLRRDMYKSHILCVDTQLCDFRQLETEEAHMGCYDPEAGTWEKLPGLPFLTHAGCTAVGHKVYVSGGICKNSYSSALYEFDSFSGHWVEHPCMAVTRTAHAFLFCSQRLFAAGGWCKFQSFISSAESFDLKSGKWSSISRLPFALSHSAASVFRKRLYLLGGATDASGHWCFHSGYLTYDIGSDLWTEVSLGTGFFAAGAVAVDNGIYVIGGYSEKKTRNWVEGNLTPENRHCTRKCFFISEAGRVSHSSGIPKLPRGIANAGVVCSGNQIYVLGGEDLTQRYKTIYHWEPGEARWHRCATNIPTPHEGISRFGCAALMRPKPHILQLFQNTSQVLVAAVIK